MVRYNDIENHHLQMEWCSKRHHSRRTHPLAAKRLLTSTYEPIPMLDPWIIEEILRREEEGRREHERGRVTPLPPPSYRERAPTPPPAEEDSNRGVYIIDI